MDTGTLGVVVGIAASVFGVSLPLWLVWYERRSRQRQPLQGGFIPPPPKPPLTTSVAALQSLAEGSPVRLCARVSSSNPKLLESFVIFSQEEFRGVTRNDREIWEVVKQGKPLFVVELSDGQVQIMNGDYHLGFYTTAESFQTETESLIINNKIESSRLNFVINGISETAYWSADTRSGTRRYVGIEARNQIVIEGKVANGPEGPAIRAEFVYAFRRRVSLLTTEAMQPSF